MCLQCLVTSAILRILCLAHFCQNIAKQFVSEWDGAVLVGFPCSQQRGTACPEQASSAVWHFSPAADTYKGNRLVLVTWGKEQREKTRQVRKSQGGVPACSLQPKAEEQWIESWSNFTLVSFLILSSCLSDFSSSVVIFFPQSLSTHQFMLLFFFFLFLKIIQNLKVVIIKNWFAVPIIHLHCPFGSLQHT